MLIVGSLGRREARYYLNGPAAGRWTGAGCAPLGLTGTVEPGHLRAVLATRDPMRHQVLIDRPGRRHRDAWGLVFAAPKSLSLLHALGDRDVSQKVADAHRRAVASALGHLEHHGMWAGRGGKGRRLIPVRGMIGAAFDHEHNFAGEPHVHTHVLVANLVEGDDGRWSAFRTGPWWVELRAAGALYQLGLRHELAQLGLRFDWLRHPNGLEDVDGVPRRSIEAASTRRRAIKLDAERWNGGPVAPSSRAVAVSQARTRSLPSAQETAAPWHVRVAVTGFGARDAQRLVEQARARGWRAPMEPGREEIARRLLEMGSTFRRADVICAIASVSSTDRHAHGDVLPVFAVERLADRFCAQAQQLAPGRWTTPEATALEEQLSEQVQRGRSRGRGRVHPALAAAVFNETSIDRSSDTTAAAWRLVTAGHGVEVLAGRNDEPSLGPGETGSWLGQAEVIDLARRAWQAAGHRVRVLTDAPGARRWEALAAIEPGSAEQASVLVVDRADRIPPPSLGALLDQADRHGTKVVLVDGGTSHPRHWPGALTLRHWPPTLGPVLVAPARLPDGHVGANALDAPGPVHVAGTGRDAIAALLHAWDRDCRDARGLPPVLVGLGAAEVAALNHAGRARWQEAGRLSGPALRRRGREFQAGDVVMASQAIDARSEPSATNFHVVAGTRGRVTAVDPDRSVVEVSWSAPRRSAAGTVRLSGAQLGRLSFGYATTPGYLRSSSEPLHVLGLPSSVGRQRDRVAGAWLTAPTSVRETGPPGDHLARLADSLPRERVSAGRAGELANLALADLAAWRDALTAELQATRPPIGAGERAWANEHADQLLTWRDLGRAAELRTDLLAWSREIQTADGRETSLGPRPEHRAQRAAWRRALRDLAVFEDRWPMADSHSLVREDLLRYRADLIRLQARRRLFERQRGRDRAQALELG